jgi:hypothetical protein
MRQISGWKGLSAALFAFFLAPVSWTLSADQRLLSLVPPSAQIVAGIDSPPKKDKPGSFVMITHNNAIDLQDFFAVTGADSSRSAGHVVFVAMDDGANHLGEHGLLASGHFDRERIYKSALEGGAKAVDYRALSVIELEPFTREQQEFHDRRWLAIPDSNLLLFGTIFSVHEELDRYLAHKGVDPSLEKKLSHFRHDDETWCVMIAPARNPEVRSTLQSLVPEIAELAGDGDLFQFGIRYRKQVEFEYEVTSNSAASSRTISQSLMRSLAGPVPASMFLPEPDVIEIGHAARGVIKIPTSRFGAWLNEVTKKQAR